MQKNEEPVNNKGKKDDKDTINGGMLMKMPRILLCAGASGSGKDLTDLWNPAGADQSRHQTRFL